MKSDESNMMRYPSLSNTRLVAGTGVVGEHSPLRPNINDPVTHHQAALRAYLITSLVIFMKISIRMIFAGNRGIHH